MLAVSCSCNQLRHDGFIVASSEDEAEGESSCLAHNGGTSSKNILDSVSNKLVRRGKGSESKAKTSTMHDNLVLVEGGVGGFIDDVVNYGLIVSAGVQQS